MPHCRLSKRDLAGSTGASNTGHPGVQALCIGIAGGSGAGKTTLVRRLARRFREHGVVVVAQDSYYRDRSAMSLEERPAVNYDHPDAIEVDLLVAHVQRLKRGGRVEVPCYDFVTHTRCGTQALGPGHLVIVEGILVLCWPELRSLFDVSVFVAQTQQERLRRRIGRDGRERGRSRASVIRQFDATVRPMHDAFVEPARAYASWQIPGDSSGEQSKTELEHEISCLLAERDGLNGGGSGERRRSS